MLKLFVVPLCFLVVSCGKAKTIANIEKHVKCLDYVGQTGVGGQVQFRDENGEIIIDRAKSSNNSLRASVVVTVVRSLENNKRVLITIDENGNVERSEMPNDRLISK